MEEDAGWAVAGGAILAFWVYGLLFGFGVPWGPWLVWGLVGFMVGGTVWGLRHASHGLRIALVAGVGGILCLLLLAAILQEEAALWASLVTGLGSSMLAMAAPQAPTGQAEPAPEQA